MNYPLKIKSSASFIEEFRGCEYGRYEDAEGYRNSKDPTERTYGEKHYKVVVEDFLCRHKTIIEVRNDDELIELYWALASGTIGEFALRAANNLLDKIRDDVREINPSLVREWPCATSWG